MVRFLGFAVKLLTIGLLVHFLVHTRVTFGRGIDAGPLRARKEIVIGVLSLLSAYFLFFVPRVRSVLLSDRSFMITICLLIGGILGTLLIHILFIDASVTRRAMAMRYDYLGFVLLVVGWIIATYLGPQSAEKILLRYGRVIKRVLLIALVRRCIVAIKPGTLKLFGFNNYVFEGTVGMQPPAVYYTHINYGLPRSQFLFERPTTFGFWLTAFFPLFFMLFLRRPVRDTRGWRAIYGLNIILTFSRAARGSWIIAVVLCVGLTTTIPRKKLLVRYGIPLFLFFAAILALGWKQIALRGYSNYGHMTMVKRGRTMLTEQPWRGRGGASVGPGSHRDGGLAFNPENQFLQLLIEFGRIGALPWLMLRGWTIWMGVRMRRQGSDLPLAFSLGMVTLTISGMVLHSFADRMVVYPFMLLLGLSLVFISRPLQKQSSLEL